MSPNLCEQYVRQVEWESLKLLSRKFRQKNEKGIVAKTPSSSNRDRKLQTLLKEVSLELPAIFLHTNTKKLIPKNLYFFSLD